jgi:DNA-directed RNA polymerase specialized sigma24 family protein
VRDVGHPTTPHVEHCIWRWCGRDEDLVQIARLAAWQASQTQDPTKGSLEAWLVKAIKLRLIDEWRRRKRAERLPCVELFDEVHAGPVEPPTDLWSRVHPTLMRVHVGGELYSEVAADLGVPTSTVWWRAQQEAADFRNRYPEERPSR